jgi:hypothetical protein
MIYSLNQPTNLERASVYDQVLEENQKYLIHRISVIREGKLIDKTKDVKIKVLDNENNIDGGVLNSSKKVNVSIKDLRLYDILIIEDTRTKQFTEKDFIRKKFYKSVWISPDTYWAYGNYEFELINKRNEPIMYKKTFFRDENENVIEPEIGIIENNESYKINYNDYINKVDVNRCVFPYIDFATKSTWEELTNYIAPFYEKVFEENKLINFADDLIFELNNINDLENKIQFAIEYVQNNVHYIYNEDEMHGHLPQNPLITYKDKQGDCKAKAVLLKVILNYLNVKSEIILVNFNNDFYLNYYLPSLLAFNHVIVKIYHNNNEYFIDVTEKDEYGKLGKRNHIHFLNYLPLKSNETLKKREAFYYDNYSIEDLINFKVSENLGQIEIKTIYRYNRANNMRKYFKNTNKREIIDSWNNFIFYSLNYHNDRTNEDLRSIFKNASIQIINDDKSDNELKILYKTDIELPYYTDKSNNKFMMYFDGNILKNIIKDYKQNDITFWHSFDSEKYEINLETDKNIDVNEKYTKQEIKIVNKYFNYEISKKIHKHGGTAIIYYKPLTNIEIPFSDFDKLKNDYFKVHDSNFGLGIDVIKSGFINSVKYKLKLLFLKE